MKHILTIVLVFTFLSTFSQEKTIFIKDSITQEAVPFAAIQFVDKQNGIYADESGKAIIPDSVQLILISQIAYHSKETNLQAIENNATVLLTPLPNVLPEIIVSNIPSKQKEIGYTKLKGDNGVIASPNTNFAVFIPYDNSWTNPPTIHSIVTILDEISGDKKQLILKANLCFDLRLPNHNGAPSDISLLEKRIINNSTKIYKGKEIVRLPNPVSFPKEGVFIIMDFITPNNPNPQAGISPCFRTTNKHPISQTWSRAIANDFKWKKMDKNDYSWKSTIIQFYGEEGIMNIRAGLQISH